MSQISRGTHVPYVPASANIPEVTFQSVLLGTLLGIVLAAANTYLGLYAGMTVSASIPAAVLSMGILKGILKRGTILENNIVQTIAASGESLAAGIIFTIPAMLITGVWTDIQFWPTTIICICGGLLGIAFMVPLRKSHIVDDETLTFPEGVACAEVLKAGETGGTGAKYVLLSMGIGAVFKFFTNGYSVFKGSVEWAFGSAKTAFFFGTDVSPALVGVGYIVGFWISFLIVLGGVITWGIAVPIYGYLYGVEGDALEWFWSVWSSKARYLGVGAMMVGGFASIISVRGAVIKGFKEAVLGYKTAGQGTKPIRTEENMKNSHLLMIIFFATVLTFCLYNYLIGSIAVSLVSTVAMLVMSFFFVAVASYIVGLVGSSNSPISGMTISAVLLTGGFLLLFGMTGTQGIIATLGVAGVVCCAASSAGDISQDLKTGYLIGATPKKQQWMEIVGAVIPAFVMAPVMIVLNHAYGIGSGQPGALKAPQATLFASLVNGLFGEGVIPWNYVFYGAIIGVVILLVDLGLKSRGSRYRTPVMAVAIGMYLPVTLAIPMLLGGAVAAVSKDRSESGKGVLFSSGLIAGEALTGVLMGTIIYFNKDALPVQLLSSNAVSLAGLGGLTLILWIVSQRK